MSSAVLWGFSGLLALVWLLGLTSNGFVMGINIWDWSHSIPLTRSDSYMFSMAISNIFLQGWSAAKWICIFIQERRFGCPATNAFTLICSCSSLLLTASLCIFYCSKIVVLKNRLLRWTQRQLTTYYRIIISVAILICILMGLPLAWTDQDPAVNLCDSSTVPCNTTTRIVSYMTIYRSVVLVFGYTVPLGFMLFSAGLMIRSLRIHMKRMHVTLKTGHEVRMEAHLQAAYTVLSLLLLFIAYFVLSLLLLIEVVPEGDPLSYICHLAPVLYSLFHSLIMMKGNGKLRRAIAGFRQKIRGLKG